MYIADLHIHSRYSRATSRDCTPGHLDLWARRKGIHIVGTGDFTHPAWREELREKLEPAEEGLYTLKPEYRIEDEMAADNMAPRFVITGEISSIYKKAGRVRKVHNLILLPGLESAELVSKKLEDIGNIHSDGRPILGLDCHDLLEILLELCPEGILVPAHIWTPHFSLLGAFSGFDSVEECFGDLSDHIHAMETGLSSDPPMNWRISALDKYQLISNSDAHSPAKLGREANLMDIELSYSGLRGAIQKGEGLYGTLEFYPEEGKYHFDGHRKCNICLSPAETQRFGGNCPVCGRKITVGVSHRVDQLADRQEGYVREQAKAFESLVPLPEVIGASIGRSASSVGVQRTYLHMLKTLGSEFDILRAIPLEEIRSKSERLIAEGIGRLREGKVLRIPGFDGEYGTIRLFQDAELADSEGQMDFFGMIGNSISEQKTERELESKYQREETSRDEGKTGYEADVADLNVSGDQQQNAAEQEPYMAMTLNQEQERAVRSAEPKIAVIAGPGTGKTKTLTARILYLLEHRKVKPGEITAVTFTNQAAAEMQERLQAQSDRRRQMKMMQIGTFHKICLNFLMDQGMEFSVLDEMEAREIAKEVIDECDIHCLEKRFLEWVSSRKSGVEEKKQVPKQEAEEWERAFAFYTDRLKELKLLDFDDLMLETLKIIEAQSTCKGWEKRFSYLFVDEFQDINSLQYRLIQAWHKEGRELFVIGDPNQSIYGFRGADAHCFKRLKEQYDSLEVITLTENYRSVPEILSAAQAVIYQNSNEVHGLNPNRESGAAVRLVSAGSDLGEAIFIAKEINRLAGGIGMLEAHDFSADGQERKLRGFEDIAILYRTHRQAELLEKCMKKEGIPYIVAGREHFLRDDTVRGSVAFFRYLENPKDPGSKVLCLKLLQKQKGVDFEKQAEELIEKYRPLLKSKKPGKFLESWMKDMELTDQEPMKKLEGMAVCCKTIGEFLDMLSLGVESDLRRCGGRQYVSGAVTLMTLHGAKGLEFPCTFLYGMKKGKMPLELEGFQAELEEERRLLYVGMTRARDELIITASGEPSRFLEEMPEEFMTREKSNNKKETGFTQMNLFDF